MVDEGAGDRDALLLAAGDLVRQAVRLLAEADQAEDLGHLAADHAPRLAHHLEGVGDVLVDGLVGQQLEVLEDAADVAAQQGHLALRQGAQVAPGHQDPPFRGFQFLEDELDEGGLAGARRPHQKDEFALADMAGEILEADHAEVVSLADVLEDDHLSGPLLTSACRRPRADYGRPTGRCNPAPSVKDRAKRGRRTPRRTSLSGLEEHWRPATPGCGSSTCAVFLPLAPAPRGCAVPR